MSFRKHRGLKGRKEPKGPLRGSDSSIRTLRGSIDKNRKGFAFLVLDTKGQEDIFIPPRQAQKLFPGDRVEVTLDSRGQLKTLRIVEHRFSEVVGRFMQGGSVIYERKRIREEIFIPQVPLRVQAGDWVSVRLQFNEKGPYPVTGELITVYGKELPASADLRMIAGEFGLVEAHPTDVLTEAKRFIQESHNTEDLAKGREDLRHVPFITIDGENARDFDDAVYVEKERENYVLWVAIADVSHYVREGTALDYDARRRGTSVYFPERAFHMLPQELSENLCSLRPHESKLCIVARMVVNSHGENLDTRIMEAVIESKRRATYTQIQSEFEKNKNNSQWEYVHHFALYRILRKMRTRRGSIDFELPEAEVVVDSQGEVQSISHRPRVDAHRLIEEFMIAANEAVTVWMMKREWPFVYRVHETPSSQSLEKFQALASHVGVRLKLKAETSPKVIADLIRQLEGHPAESLLNIALLRSMKQAVYKAQHGIHFGLASQAYTHFTSPIRRYPDLVVHRLLKMALRRSKETKGFKKKIEKELDQICDHCSYRERLAADAERESVKLKQVRLMIRYVGDEFSAKVVGMINAGIFVQIENPFVEGMLALDTLPDDIYEFVEERMIVRGRRKKQVFKIGDSLRVKVVRADVELRQIDLIKID